MSRFTRLEDYALIGDCETAALVSIDGSIDWLCWPRFDSGACFASILGGPEFGRWRIAPVGGVAEVTRRYIDETLILETTFETERGAVALIDFMPAYDDRSDLLRIVRGIRGEVEMRTELLVRFDYGSVVPWVSRTDKRTHRIVAGPDLITLRSSVEEHGESLKTVGDWVVRKGEEYPFALTWSASHLKPPDEIDALAALERTRKLWSEWSARCTYDGKWRKVVMRSLLTLKALTYAPTGGIVAAPTTSLPEHIGGVRNWDYRFCWLRDATLTLLALLNAGYTEEAGAWRDWLLRAAAGSPEQVQIMYGISGERMLRESTLPWLPGYEKSAPVRIGNAAHSQMQLDVYGEVMDALHQANVAGLAESDDAWALQVALTNHVAAIWRQPDSGIWEVRGPPQHFTHSKVMAWVAVDRAVQSAEQFGLPAPLTEWRALRDEIHAEVCDHGFNANMGCFVQAYDTTLLDASLLMLPLVGFLPPDDPRIVATVECIEQRLVDSAGFVLRYDTARTEDGLPEGEGAFLACSFWLADCYVVMGRRADA
ncbi:MAG TPA: glycoside hydrolase family 15 protein, partial [Gemmatimonadaceae bacterium]